MPDQKDLGLSEGKVAERLCRILYRDLTPELRNAIVVCLFAHLLVEKKINELLYQWLNQDAPAWGRPDGHPDDVVQASEKLWNEIVKMTFSNKLRLVRPSFGVYFPQESAESRRD